MKEARRAGKIERKEMKERIEKKRKKEG